MNFNWVSKIDDYKSKMTVDTFSYKLIPKLLKIHQKFQIDFSSSKLSWIRLQIVFVCIKIYLGEHLLLMTLFDYTNILLYHALWMFSILCPNFAGFLDNFGKSYESILNSILDHYSKLHLGLNAQPINLFLNRL